MDTSFQNSYTSFKVSCSRLKIFRVRQRFKIKGTFLDYIWLQKLAKNMA